jgi:cyclophilin family peptidyl-prolyl cis-trans isomerase
VTFLASLSLAVLAAPPAAPSVTLVDFSKAGIDSAGLIYVGSRQSYVVQWQDNSVDEEGFEIRMKGPEGAAFTAGRAAANSTQALITPVSALEAGKAVQFQVVAWKYNGSKIETSTSPAFNFTIPEGTASDLTSPGSPAVSNINDGIVRLSWVDRSNSELYHQVDFREVKNPAVEFQTLGFTNLSGKNFTSQSTSNPVSHQFRARLIPGTHYEFRVRATRQANVGTSSASGWSNIVPLQVPALTSPTQLSATNLQENALRLNWLDNSTNETGYEIQYRDADSTNEDAFIVFSTAAEDANSAQFFVPQGASYDWRVVAVYSYTPSGSTTATTLRSAPSNIVSSNGYFAAPTELTASTSGMARTADLAWKDNSTTEVGFNVYTRPQGTEDWFFARAVRENVTKVSVNSRQDGEDADGKPVFVSLEAGTLHEFVVRAVGSNETTFSAESNTATATVIDGFTSRNHHPGQVGVSFSYQAATSNSGNRTSWNISGMPSGLAFDQGTGILKGTPTTHGVFHCTMTASFVDAPTASAPLTLRILKTATSPSVVPGKLPNLFLGIGAKLRIPLSDKFVDADAESGVRLETTKGNIDIQLFPSLAPNAVANFLSYVESGDYNNVVFHRLASGFVLQGGSMRAAAIPRSFSGVAQRPSPVNEPGISNVRGTLAAAKLGARTSFAALPSGTVARDEQFGYVGNPDSATTDFFFNLVNNAENLDNQNGGFTAFGRLSNAAMSVVDSIAALPAGTYQNTNSGTSYSPSLDKRVVVDGSLTPLSGIPMNATTAPADMDINKTIQIKKAYLVPSIRYVVNSNPTGIVRAEIDGNDLLLTGLIRGLTSVTVIAVDLDNRSSSQSFTVETRSGYAPAAITRHPVSTAVLQGTKATFTVTATGAELQYQWRRNGQNVGTNSKTLVIENVQPADAGSYDVVVSNGSATRISAPARLDIRILPTVGALEVFKVVEAGSPLTLQVSHVTGAPAPSILWKKGAAAVAGQTTPTLNIKSAKLADAGVYTATASNSIGKSAPSNESRVFVVDKSTRTVVQKQGAVAMLKAEAAGPDIQYQWRKAGVNILTNRERFSGVQTPSMSISACTAEDIDQYDCVITLPDGLGTMTTGVTQLLCVTHPVLPALTGINAPPPAYIGIEYRWTLPYSKFDIHTPSRFTLSGLPPGMKFDTLTGVISGRPTKAGTYRLSATASNLAGISAPAAQGDLVVTALPPTSTGIFAGTVGASDALNGSKGGRFDLVISETGTYTAKMILGTEVLSAAGALGIGLGLSNPSGLSYQSLVKFTRKNKTALTLSFETDSTYGYITGILSDGTSSIGISGFRLPWHATWNPCPYGSSPTQVIYNMAIDLSSEDDIGDSAIPQGSGFLSMKVDSKGLGAIAGKLSDGTSITSSSLLGPGGEAMLFTMLYKNTGSILARLDIGDNVLTSSEGAKLRVNGQARWNKSVQPGTERNYQGGFPEVFLSILGTIYVRPGTGKIVMGLPNAPANAEVKFTQGGVGTASRVPDRTVRISTAQAVSYPTNNDAKTSLSINATTGAFSGRFELKDGLNNEVRSVAYQGIIIPTIPATPEIKNSSGTVLASEIPGSPGRGAGYFLLPELKTSASTQKINSGIVLLRGIPITITTQPVSQTVNPGGPVSFTVAVAGSSQGVVTYQWRKNGASIFDATSATLYLTSVTKANDEGTYDCVITNGSSVVTSSSATLSINTPVTTVTASRSPAGTTLATGTKVTFTATANGTSPQYQWRLNGSNITGANSSTYVIDSLTLDHAGSYTVAVTNVVTSAEIVSTAVPLAVAQPVTITTVGRTPSDVDVAPGSPVTFSVTVTGSSQNLAYQWRKGTIAIPGATGPDYTIDSADTSHVGGYDVVVKNIVTTGGVLSNTIFLGVLAPVTSVTLSRSPAASAVANGTKVTFTAATNGSSPVYQWRKDGNLIDGASSSTLVINSSAEGDSGTYSVTVTNSLTPAGVTSSGVPLVVAAPVNITSVGRTPGSASLPAGSEVTFAVFVTGSTQNLTYQWRKDGSAVPDATGPSLVISSASEEDEGSYDVVVKNIVSTSGVTSSAVPLVID